MEFPKLSRAAGLDGGTECISSSLELFDGPLVETSIDKTYFNEIHPITPISASSNSINFHIPSSSDFTDLSESYLTFRVSINTHTGGKEVAGGAQAANDSYALVNQIGSSLFTAVNVRLNDSLLSDSYGTANYRAYFQSLLNYSSDAQKTRLRLMGFCRDDKPDTTDASTAAAASSYKTRAAWTSEGRILVCTAPVFHDLWNQSRLLIPLCPIFVDFTKASKEFAIISNKTACDYEYKILSMQLMIRRVKTTASTKLQIENRLSSTPARYPITQASVKPFWIDQNLKSCTFENCFAGKGVPKFALFGLCEQTAFRGDYSKNPFLWKHQDLVSLKVSFGADSYPSVEFKPVYTSATKEEDWSTEYFSLCLNTFKAETGIQITYEQFKEYYCLYVIDLGQFSMTSNDHITPKADVSARLDIRFSSSVTGPPACVGLMYCEWDCEIRVNSNRVVSRDYIL